jgi:integration host factor subunit beta
MIKSELVARLAARNPALHGRDVERLVATVLGQITDTLAKGGRVELRGFGIFGVKVRPTRIGRNPQNGASLIVRRKRMPFFRTGKVLHDRLNAPRAMAREVVIPQTEDTAGAMS